MNLYKIISIFAFLIVYSVSALAQQPAWFQKITEISLLRSNYQDVIRIFDLSVKVKMDQDAFHRYLWEVDSSDGSTQVLFKRGEPCVDGSTSVPGWNVPEWTVVGVDYFPAWKKQIKLNQLPFKTDGFKVYSEQNNHSRYYNLELGITVDVDDNKLVEGIQFSPPSDLGFLRCHEN